MTKKRLEPAVSRDHSAKPLPKKRKSHPTILGVVGSVCLLLITDVTDRAVDRAGTSVNMTRRWCGHQPSSLTPCRQPLCRCRRPACLAVAPFAVGITVMYRLGKVFCHYRQTHSQAVAGNKKSAGMHRRFLAERAKTRPLFSLPSAWR